MEIAYYMRAGVKNKLRYSELRKELANITDAVLAAALKELIADDMVARKAYNEIPPHVEYELTEKGTSAIPILQSICRCLPVSIRSCSLGIHESRCVL